MLDVQQLRKEQQILLEVLRKNLFTKLGEYFRGTTPSTWATRELPDFIRYPRCDFPPHLLVPEICKFWEIMDEVTAHK